MDHIETEHGLAHYPVGVVEDDKTLRLVSVEVDLICFASIPPGPVLRTK